MSDAAQVVLRLYVSTGSPNSALAATRLRAAVAERSDVEVTIIDVFEYPERAAEDRVLLTPMLVRVRPTPSVRVVGTLGDDDALAEVLGGGR